MAFEDIDRRVGVRERLLRVGVGAMLAFSMVGSAATLPGDEHFKVETIAGGFIDAMEMAVASDGRVFVVERTGGVHLFDPSTSATTRIA